MSTSTPPITVNPNTLEMKHNKDKPPSIPITLAPFFQEYDLARLDLQRDQSTIIERVLQYGNREEIRWLFWTYPGEEIRAWVERRGNIALPEPQRTFWRLVLGLQEGNQ